MKAPDRADGSADSRAGPRANMTVLSTWLFDDLAKLVSHFTVAMARWRALLPELLRSLVGVRKTPAMVAIFGLVIAGTLRAPWALLVPVAALLVMAYRSNLHDARFTAMQNAVRQLANLLEASSATTKSAPTEEIGRIEETLLQSVGGIAGVRQAGVARPENPNEPKRGLSWSGSVEPEVQARFKTIDELVDFAGSESRSLPGGTGRIGVWGLDAKTMRHLVVVTSHRASTFKKMWDTMGYLARGARGAIDNSHQKTALVDDAKREYVRARTDEATGLPNAFAARAELERRLEEGLDAPLGVVAVAVLGYKQLVDVLGKERGDEAIAAFAQRLEGVAGVEYLARVNPAEFVFFATGSADDLIDLADRARRVENGDGKAADFRDASAAIAIAYPGQPVSGLDLISRVDLALDRVDESGAVVVFGDAELADEQRRVEIRLRLTDAVTDRELWPAFQPQIDLQTGEVAGLEVLARWTCPGLGLVSPAEFIGVAEESNQINRLTASMLEQALDAHRVWAAQGATFPIAVNLSVRTLARPRILASLVDIVKQSGLPAEMLTLEVTESTLVSSTTTIGALSKLSDLGARISIDDFGTGYSSLSYLEQLPIHELKIDRSMVIPLDEPGTISPVIRWLTRMCQDLGIVVVGEGVETERQLRRLQDLHVNVGQGFFFARPMTADDTTTWLRNYRPSLEAFNPRGAAPTPLLDAG